MNERDLALLVVLGAMLAFLLVVVGAAVLELSSLANQLRQAVP
jgi:hypothetical protein